MNFAIRKIVGLTLLVMFLMLPSGAQTREEKLAIAKRTFDDATMLLKSGPTFNKQAREKFLAASVLFKEIGDTTGEARALISVATLYEATEDYELAEVHYKSAFDMRKTAGSDGTTKEDAERFRARKFYNDAIEAYSRDDYDRVLSLATHGFEIDERINSAVGMAWGLNLLGKVYYKRGNYDRARLYYRRGLHAAESANDGFGIGHNLSSLGSSYYRQGNYGLAQNYYERSLQVRRGLNDKNEIARALNDLANISQQLGDYPRSLELREEALGLWQQTGNKAGVADALTDIGWLYYDLGDHVKSLECLTKAVMINREIDQRWGVADGIDTIGLNYLKVSRYHDALKRFRESNLLFRKLGNRDEEARTLNHIGEALFRLRDHRAASVAFERSLVIAREIKAKLGEGEALGNLMLLSRFQNKPILAVLYGKQALNAYQDIRFNIQSLEKSLQRSFLLTKEGTYRTLADILIGEGRILEAQEVLNLLKDEEFGRLAARSGAPVFTLPYSGAEEAAIKAVDRVASFSRELNELKAKASPTAADTKRILDIQMIEIPAANKALMNALESLRKAAPNIGKLLADRRKENVQSILPELGENVVAIYTVVGALGDKPTQQKQIGWTMVVFPNGTSKAYPIDTTNLNQAVFDFRLALQGSNCDPENSKDCQIKKLGQDLYRRLFLQVAPKLQKTLADDLDEYFKNHKNKVLMWSLDGVLRYIPMAALYNGNGFLVEKYTNVLFNTASLGSLKDKSEPNWKVLGLGVSEASSVKLPGGKAADFYPLIFAEEELRSLIKEGTGNDTEGIFPGVLKLNKEFDKNALVAGMLDKPSLVHISSHFAYNPFDEAQSYLLLGNNEKLEVKELEPYPTLFTGVDLLTLAACDTATGSSSSPISLKNNSNGKEMEGLAYVAQMKGARSVMGSLWKVSDRGSKVLALRFYELRKARPELSKGEALRQAQLTLLKGTHDPDGAMLNNPYYWAPFVLIGNWR